jgi:capsule synthesis protein PGA_cap
MTVYGGGFAPHSPQGQSEPPARPAPGRGPWGGRRTAILVGAIAAVVVGAGTATAAVVLGNPTGGPAAQPPAQGSTTAAAKSSGAAARGPADGITMTATGDIVMGSAPNGLPPDSGKGFFDDVKDALAADFQMGNLEQTITDDTGVGKCSAQSAGSTCFAYRTPPAFVRNLKDAGFMLMNQANNHAYDFGPAGYKNTQKNLDSAGIKYTGWPGMIPVAEVKGVKIAVIGFAPYPTWANSCTDLANAQQLVRDAKARADLVVVQVHQGGEGSDRQHTKPGPEYFLGENRCDSIAFGHAVVDAGADLVIGHGPHVVRAMEFYKGHLIAYSLGNLAGYKALSYKGVVGAGAILRVTLGGDGTFKSGSIAPTAMIAPGLPRLDPKKQSIALISTLTKSDFPSTGAHIGADGSITPR